MKTYNYFEAEQNYSMVLNAALAEDVIIRKKDAAPANGTSPFNIAGINTDMTRQDILNFLKESRER
jgi:hypothetical protein